MREVSHKDWLRNGLFFDFLILEKKILEKCSEDFFAIRMLLKNYSDDSQMFSNVWKSTTKNMKEQAETTYKHSVFFC